MNNRLARLREKLAQEKLDGLLVTRPQNQFYLTGFSPGETYLDATLLISAEHAWVSTDSRYYEDVKRRARDFTLFEAGYDRNKALGEFAATAKVKTMGFEMAHLTVATLKDWSKVARKAGLKLKPTTDMVENLRIVKEPVELAAIKRAVKLADDAIAHFRTVVKPGMTEKQAAWEIEKYMRENGADKIAFDLIVAGGPNGALPHAIPGDHQLQLGEPIVVDIGCRVDAYHSDLTRTLYLSNNGKVDDKFQQVYRTVLKAQETAERKIKAGMKGKRADAIARDVIEKTNAEWGKTYGHGLGHGVGLAVHESPRASKLSKDVYLSNMTLTIEPGIYLPDWGGVRIEDLVVIGEKGVEILSQASKDPLVSV